MVHADAFAFGVLSQLFVKAAGNAQLELPGVVFQAVRKGDVDSLIKRCGNPFSLCVGGKLNCLFQRIGARNAPGQIGKGGDVAALIWVLLDLHFVRQR